MKTEFGRFDEAVQDWEEMAFFDAENKSNQACSLGLNSDPIFIKYRIQRTHYWDTQARESGSGLSGYYHRRLLKAYQNVIQKNQRVLEIGCSEGNLLASLEPSFGVGVDFSAEMVSRAKTKYPQLNFIVGDAHQLPLDSVPFDAIILSDLLNDAWDVQTVFENLKSLCHSGTRIIINAYSRLWELPLFFAEKLHLARPSINQNWLTPSDIENLLGFENFEVIRTWQEILLPLNIPLLTGLLNHFLVKIWPFNELALTNFMMIRPMPASSPVHSRPSVSVVVPARNEAGNIERIFESIPQMGSETELIFVEGHSTDNTYQAIEACMAAHPQVECRLFRQTGKGKGDAVRMGFDQARGDILMILDADLTVPANYLPRFYEAIQSKKGEFINGVRLIYPMEKQAMRFLNLIGNKLFGLAFTWLLGQSIKDTLCGTKVLWRKDYDRIAKNRSYFGDFDPFGDFDLLFGAAKLGLKIVDMPIRYRDRTYGTTNIQRWKHGLLLLKMAFFAAQRLKFI